jgi:hypothetical protein
MPRKGGCQNFPGSVAGSEQATCSAEGLTRPAEEN